MCGILSLSVTGIVRKMAGASMLPFSPPGLACPVSVCSVDVSYLFVFLVLLTFFGRPIISKSTASIFAGLVELWP